MRCGRYITAAGCLLALLMGVLPPHRPARGDRLTLIDGRQFTGKITEQSRTVTIRTADGAASFPADEVLDVEVVPSAEDQLAERLAAIRAEHADATFTAATWASQHGLEARGKELLASVVEIDADHAGARRALRHVRIGGQWHPFEKALKIVSARIAGGQVDESVDACLNDLLSLARETEDRQTIRQLQAYALLRHGLFVRAGKAFAKLAESDSGDRAVRLGAIAEILAEHPDGLYVLTEDYPPEARLLGRQGDVIAHGPAALSEPSVLEAALREKARGFITAGAKKLAQARAVEPTEPEQALRTYMSALAEFGRADALVAGIARSYRIQITRRRIALIRKGAESLATRFDAELTSLGRRNISRRAYEEKVARMMRHLKSIGEELARILALAQPYPKELILEIKWAELDKQKIVGMQATLRQELDESP